MFADMIRHLHETIRARARRWRLSCIWRDPTAGGAGNDWFEPEVAGR